MTLGFYLSDPNMLVLSQRDYLSPTPRGLYDKWLNKDQRNVQKQVEDRVSRWLPAVISTDNWNILATRA